MNLRLVLNLATVIIFLILTFQTCLALPIEVFCLTAGIVLFGALAYLAASELVVWFRLETHGRPVQAIVVEMRQNRVGWQRLRVEIPVPEGTLQKWIDETTYTTACKHSHDIGDTVTVMLSKDWQHCRLYEADATTFCQVGTIMTILSLGSVVATGKMLLLTFLLLSRRACGGTCETFRCEDEFETRMLYACLVGATVYADLLSVIKQRYFDRFPSLTETELVPTISNESLPTETCLDTTDQETDEMMDLKVTSTESTDEMEVV